MNYLIYTGILLLLATACHQKNPSGQSRPGRTDSAQKNFFPVADYIQSEISYVDSTPLALLKYTIQDKKTDSAFIRPEEFHKLAQEFIPAELTTGSFEKNFSENSFMDATTGSLAFTYSTQNKVLSLRRVDVLATPGAAFDQVKSLYLEKVFSGGDTLVIKKMFWKAKKSFLIVTILQPREKAPVVRQIKVVWDTE